VKLNKQLVSHKGANLSHAVVKASAAGDRQEDDSKKTSCGHDQQPSILA